MSPIGRKQRLATQHLVLPNELVVGIVSLIAGMVVAALVVLVLFMVVSWRVNKKGPLRLGFEGKGHQALYAANLLIVVMCVTIPSGFASASVYLYARYIIQIAQKVFDEVCSTGQLGALVECVPELITPLGITLVVLIFATLLLATRAARDAVGNVLEELYRPLDANLIPSLVCLMPALLLVASFSVAVFGSLTMSSAAFFQIEGGQYVVAVLLALSATFLLFAGFRPSEVSFSCRQINKLRSSLHALFGRLCKKPRESESGNR